MPRIMSEDELAAHQARFGRQRKEKPPKGAKSVAYEFRHIRAKAAPDAIPAMPSLAEALGV